MQLCREESLDGIEQFALIALSGFRGRFVGDLVVYCLMRAPIEEQRAAEGREENQLPAMAHKSRLYRARAVL
jgi:hypothetical protein